MKYGVIDVGSNSVRLMLSENGRTLYKLIETTRLASSLDENGFIDLKAAENTLLAFSSFAERAKEEGVDKLYAFATAAVRKAKNGGEFVKLIYERCGVPVEILSGEQEAEAGFKGALCGKDGGVIDIGVASTEISVVKNGEKVYGKSVNIGAVTLTKTCGENGFLAEKTVKQALKEFGIVPKSSFFAIGGTATSIAAICLKLTKYDPVKVDGFVLEKSELNRLKDKLYSTSVEDRKKIAGLQPQRADIIQSGAAILCGVSDSLGLEKITISEKDNLEGYLLMKTEQK